MVVSHGRFTACHGLLGVRTLLHWWSRGFVILLSLSCHYFSALSALLGVAVDCCYLFRLQTQPGGVIVVVFLFSFESL